MNCTNCLCDVKLSDLFTESVEIYQVGHHIPSWNVLQNQIQIINVLKRVKQRHHPFVVSMNCVGISVKLALVSNMEDLVFGNHFTLLELFHRIDLFCLFHHNNPHLSKSTTTNDPDGLKVISAQTKAPQSNKFCFLLIKNFSKFGLFVRRKLCSSDGGFQRFFPCASLSESLKVVIIKLFQSQLALGRSFISLYTTHQVFFIENFESQPLFVIFIIIRGTSVLDICVIKSHNFWRETTKKKKKKKKGERVADKAD
mmetsp:Transcript_16845/g.26241  ORF Transcript_16845/g.26241 Transcript_16845/m.26241 type:complete len:255 (+) Transcript_16845:882-1646(+)